MKRRRLYLALGALGLVLVCLLPRREHIFELDSVNLRLRECFRYRSVLAGFVLWESCGSPEEHPTAARLRELRVLAPVREQDSKWVLVKGFTWGARGWIGPGQVYLRTLGPTSFGTPVSLPAEEDLSQNPWVQWAVKDPAAATHFWQEFRAVLAHTPHREYYLWAAREYLEEHKLQVVGAELEARARGAIGQ